VDDLNGAASLLRWDQTTYMPPGGAPARGRQLATLSRLAHERFTEAEDGGRLLDEAARETASLPFESTSPRWCVSRDATGTSPCESRPRSWRSSRSTAR
jgi:Zn-dependent M32 family carboxypeptidase